MSPSDVELRINLIRPRWERAGAGTGAVQILRHLTLADPYEQIPFPIVRADTHARRLTAADVDPKSLQRMPDGTFWIGEEHGPYLLHVDARGRVLDPPVPFSEATRGQRRFRGHRHVAQRTLPLPDPGEGCRRRGRRPAPGHLRVRHPTGRYTGRTWDYRVDTDANLVADAQLVGRRTLLVLERDDFEGGDAAVTKRVYRVDLDRTDRSGMLAKTLVVDLLKLDNPRTSSATAPAGEPATRSASVCSRSRRWCRWPNGNLLIANDNNYPGQRGTATRDIPDDTEMIIIDPDATCRPPRPSDTVIAHRGASGYRPEHTLASYALAIRQCADVIEPDVVLTKDDVLVARHENEIGGTTDVATHPEFADRRASKIIDGRVGHRLVHRGLHPRRAADPARQGAAAPLRPANTAFDGKYPIPTLAEVLDLARHSRTCSGQPVGVTPETKHPTYFASIGQPIGDTAAGCADRGRPQPPHAPR